MEKLLKKYQYKKYSGLGGIIFIIYFIVRALVGGELMDSGLDSIFGGWYFIVLIMGLHLIENTLEYLRELVGKDRYLLRMIPLERNKILSQYIKDSLKYIFKYVLGLGLFIILTSLIFGLLNLEILKSYTVAILVLSLEIINIFVIINLISVLFYRFSRGSEKIEKLSKLFILLGIILTLGLGKLGQFFINKKLKLIFSSSRMNLIRGRGFRPEKYRQILEIPYIKSINNELYINLAGSILLILGLVVMAYVTIKIYKSAED